MTARRSTALFLAVVIAAAGASSCGTGGDGAPEAWVVDQIGDRADADPDDGVCDVDLGRSGSQCTLRAAVQEANRRGGPDRIQLPGGYILRSSLGSDGAAGGDLDILGDLRITGRGPEETVLDGAGADPIFRLDRGAELVLAGLALTGGEQSNGTRSGSARLIDVVAADSRNDVGLRGPALHVVFSCGLNGDTRLRYFVDNTISSPPALAGLPGGAF
jgi:CSLREA domain-containing protein